jgi:hypothetical protein
MLRVPQQTGSRWANENLGHRTVFCGRMRIKHFHVLHLQDNEESRDMALRHQTLRRCRATIMEIVTKASLQAQREIV